jgi:signal peptidase II
MYALLSVAGLILAADQASKFAIRAALQPGQTIPLITGWFQLTYVQNTGAAFGLFSHRQPVFVIATVLAICLILFYHIKTKETNAWFNIALGLELGGAFGNLIDRVSLGWVTDFVHVTNFPVFNVADSAIVIGVMALIIAMIVDIRRGPGKEEINASDTV